ncbi:MAG: hypothetical protein A3F46_02920 [Legionellales bacterium RIFCSPHIGHO2_12_FULL_42_9]|nr:MAG: hypothetical protein A3F46_02920 [Legionellales bacterium RIFCSPHIGHO2_12_FULL_42_9]
MGSMQRTSFSWLGDEFYQISACLKFEIKKLEAHCYWIMYREHELTEEHIIRLKANYITLASYYERLAQIDLLQKIDKPCFDPLSSKQEFTSVSKSALLEFFKVIQEAEREMIIAHTRSDKVSFMVRMSGLCLEFSALLEDYLKRDESVNSYAEGPNLPIFSSKETTGYKTQPSNEKLESLFRVLERP